MSGKGEEVTDHTLEGIFGSYREARGMAWLLGALAMQVVQDSLDLIRSSL